MIEEINKNLEQLSLERIKEILPEYIHKTSKNPPPLSESLNYLLNEEITFKNDPRVLQYRGLRKYNFPRFYLSFLMSSFSVLYLV